MAGCRLAGSSCGIGRAFICGECARQLGLAHPVCAEMIEAPLIQRSRGFIGPILRTAVPLDAAELFADLLDRIDRRTPGPGSMIGGQQDFAPAVQFSKFSTQKHHQ